MTYHPGTMHPRSLSAALCSARAGVNLYTSTDTSMYMNINIFIYDLSSWNDASALTICSAHAGVNVYTLIDTHRRV